MQQQMHLVQSANLMAWVQEMFGWMDGWMDGMAWRVEMDTLCHGYTTLTVSYPVFTVYS